MIKFLGFPLGKKCEICRVPKLILNAKSSYKRAFALGVLTFDGSVDCRGAVGLGMKSKDIVTNVYKIITEETITLRPLKYSKKKGQYCFRSGYRDPRLLNYFEKGTEKWYRLNELVYGFQGKVDCISSAKIAFDKCYSEVARSKISFTKIIDIISTEGSFTNKQLVDKLNSGNNPIASTSLGVYLYLLRKSNIIRPLDLSAFKRSKLDNKNVILAEKFRANFFGQLFHNFRTQQDLADLLGRTQSVISNYIYGKKSIPLYDLRKMAKIIKISNDTLNNNIVGLTNKTPAFNHYMINDIKYWKVPWRPYLEVIKYEK